MIDAWTALRLPVRTWARWRERDLAVIPRPRDAARAHAVGPDAIDVLMVGSGAASGWGVLTHELGLVGAFCRAVAQRRHGGVTVAGTVDPELRMRDVTPLLEEQSLDVFGIICLVLGVNDVMAVTSRAEWSRELGRALDAIESRRSPGAQILVAGIQPLRAIPVFASRVARILEPRAQQLNELTRAECARRHGVTFVDLPATPGGVENVYGDSARYAFWAEILAAGVANDTLSSGAPSVRGPQPVQRTQALERTGIAGTDPEERFDRIVRAARSVFQTSHAAFTVVGVGRQWYKSLAGPELADNSIEHSFCYRLVDDGGPLVVPDARQDPRFAENAFVWDDPGLSFYAGYPVRAPSGEPIGALCVFDASPRDPETIDLASLREFALMVEAEVSARAEDPVSGTPARQTKWPQRRR